MELHTLHPAEGATKSKKRIGRGQGSGRGGTSTRGHKGAQSRSGYSRKAGFEGGQMPLQRRVPKFGFKNPFRKEYQAINLDGIQRLAEQVGDTISLSDFISHGFSNKRDLVKVLGKGELKNKVKVEAHAFSDSARAAIEKAGGEAISAQSSGKDKE